MAKEMQSIDISNQPELLHLVEEMQKNHEPRLLKRDSEELAILMPAKPVKRRLPRGKPFTKDDPLWNLAGQGASGLGDVSENKHKYLADAYANLHK